MNTCFLSIPINGPKSMFSVLKFVFCILQYYKTTRFHKFRSIYISIYIHPNVLKPESHALPHILFTYLQPSACRERKLQDTYIQSTNLSCRRAMAGLQWQPGISKRVEGLQQKTGRLKHLKKFSKISSPSRCGIDCSLRLELVCKEEREQKEGLPESGVV